MKKTLAWALTAVTAATCALGATVPAAAAEGAPVTASVSTTKPDTSGLSPETRAIADAYLALLPADWQDRLQAAAAKYGIHDSQLTGIRNGVINPGDYQCRPSGLTTYVRSQVAKAKDPYIFFMLAGMLDLPTYDAILFGSESRSNSFGVNGEYTHQLTSEMKDLKKFWDIPSGDIQLIPMHGADLFSSPERLARLFVALYGTPADTSRTLADLVIRLIGSEPSLEHGASPLFTLNALAFSDSQEADPLGVSDRIIVGDGVLQGMASLGLGDTAPRAILAHEFGHQVQFADGLLKNTTLTGPESSRRAELMADAFGTYYLTHSRGEALNAKRVLDSEKSFYDVGDCDYTGDTHHGTPNQRFAASSWGASVADTAANQGHILPSMKLDGLFEAKLPDIVKPDAAG
ncbi:hypothetical protein ACIRRH_40765 [Kitasatospora sp. NPDC101235]|uniref:hypothetical protein n=1 Tax=Kitasatospora sp. NPDC101235 TaxID=3364101 RepID=UPI00382E1EF2